MTRGGPERPSEPFRGKKRICPICGKPEAILRLPMDALYCGNCGAVTLDRGSQCL